MKKASESSLVKALPVTPATAKLLEAATTIQLSPDATEAAFLARQLVQCTLPHRDPGDTSLWTRTSGDLTIVIARTQVNLRTGKPVGYSYGTLPRLLLLWINPEAVRNKSRRLELGNSLSKFMRELGLDYKNGTGPRGDARRLREQMNRLFAASISFQAANGRGRGWLEMKVAPKGVIWWDAKQPGQDNLTIYGEAGLNSGKTSLGRLLQPQFLLICARLESFEAPLLRSISIRGQRIGHSLPEAPMYTSWHDLQKQLGAEYGELKGV